MVQQASRVRVVGPLASWRAGFADALARRGYAPLSAANQLRVMAHLSRWLDGRGLAASDLSVEVVGGYLASRRAAGYVCWLSPRGLAPLLEYLRGVGAAPAPVVAVASGRLEELVERYRDYLVGERGLTSPTVGYYLRDARLFLAGWVDQDAVRLDRLGAAQVTAFVVEQCGRRSVGMAKILVTALRSLLRFLLLDGLIGQELAAAVPAVAGWRDSGLPKAIGAAQVSALLACCDGRGGVGRRDRAILLVLTPGWVCVRLRWPGCGLMTLTGAAARSPFGVRVAAMSGCRFRSMSARRSWTICGRAGRRPRPGRCSWALARRLRR